MKKITVYIKKEAVLVIAAIFAIISMVFVPPNTQYLTYIDFPVLGILFCLMAVVAGFMELGLLDFISTKMIVKSKSVKILRIILVNCVFFAAMLFTNDVALIAFVPITIGIFNFVGRKKLISTIVLETIAANIGSMLTPVGNPQNLYLYSFYNMNISQFEKIVLPVGIAGYIILMCILLVSKNGNLEVSAVQRPSIEGKKVLFPYLICVFILCILSVLHIIDYRICVLTVLVGVAVLDRKLFKKVDYGLLFTFVAFFVFVGNLEQIEPVKSFLISLLSGRVFMSSILSSQVISNVPAAMMISHFTDEARNLLLGVDIGGMGTPIASLASLISLKLYFKSEGSAPVKYLGIFTIYNIAFLIMLIIAAILLFTA